MAYAKHARIIPARSIALVASLKDANAKAYADYLALCMQVRSEFESGARKYRPKKGSLWTALWWVLWIQTQSRWSLWLRRV